MNSQPNMEVKKRRITSTEILSSQPAESPTVHSKLKQWQYLLMSYMPNTNCYISGSQISLKFCGADSSIQFYKKNIKQAIGDEGSK